MTTSLTIACACRIRSREQYQDFLKTLNLYAQEIISRTEMHAMIYDILGRSNDLMVRCQISGHWRQCNFGSFGILSQPVSYCLRQD